jgi:hypothetical protein
MRQLARFVFLAAVCVGLASDGLAGDSSVFKIPVTSIGAPPPKAVAVDYLRGDGSVVQQLSKVPLSDGVLQLSAVPGSSEVRIAAEGFDATEVSLSHGALGVSLSALSRLLLKWPFKTESRLPLSIELHVLRLGKRPAPTMAAALVPGTDTFSASVPPGKLALFVYSPGAGAATSPPLELSPGSLTRVEKLQVLPSRDRFLRISDPGGHPLPTASLRFRCEDDSASTSPVGSWLSHRVWKTDAKGKIELRSIPLSSCAPALTSRGYRAVTLQALPLGAAEASVQVVVLRPLPQLILELDPSVLGRDDSAEVSLIGSETKDDEDSAREIRPPASIKIWSGRVVSRQTIRGLEGGQYRAFARSGGRTAGAEFQISAAPEASDEQTVRLHFDPRPVRGHVFVGERPGSGVSVQALAEDRLIKLDDDPLASTTTGEDGSFEISVSYIGGVVLRARLSENNLVYQRVEPDPDPEKEVVLRGWASAIQVRAFDAATGESIPDGTVEMTLSQSGGGKMISTRPVPGQITLAGLGPGGLKLRLSSPRHRVEEMNLTLSGEEKMPLDFMLRPKSDLVVTVTGESGEPVEGCSVLSVDPMKIASPGTTLFHRLGLTDWSGRAVLDDVPSDTILAFFRPGYSLQFSRSSSLQAESGSELRSVSATLPSLREKVSLSAAQRLAQSLAGPPTFVVLGFVVPEGLGRYLAELSGLDDQALLRAGPEGLLLWSRILPPGDYTIFTRTMRPTGAAGGREPQAPFPPNVTTATLN